MGLLVGEREEEKYNCTRDGEEENEGGTICKDTAKLCTIPSLHAPVTDSRQEA